MLSPTLDRTSITPRATPGSAVLRHYDRPWLFYAVATAIPWTVWLLAAALSHRPAPTAAVMVATAALGVIGLAAPVAVAAALIVRKPELRADVRRRLTRVRGIGWPYVVAAIAAMPASILVATAVSVLLGADLAQFHLRHGWTFSAGLLPVWFTLVAAAVLEELAWHGYGTDALLSRLRLFTASMLFAVIWTLWHAPLSLIKGYYHNEVVAQGWLHTLNFPVSLVVFVVIMNWLYLRTGRSIWVPIVVHVSANFANEVFATQPDTKIIQTGLLLIVASVVLVVDRPLFFARPAGSRGEDARV